MNTWKDIVATFLTEKEREEGVFSVQDLCANFLHQEPFCVYWQDKDVSHVLAFLRDYKSVSQSAWQFHTTWNAIPNMENIARHESQEIQQIDELIARLEALHR